MNDFELDCNQCLSQNDPHSKTMDKPNLAKSSTVVEVMQALETTSKAETEIVDIPGVPNDVLEDDIRKSQKLDTVSILYGLRLTSIDTSRMKVPLCRMVPMPMVRPTLACNLMLLEN